MVSLRQHAIRREAGAKGQQRDFEQRRHQRLL